jgi:hypothetical protein
VFVGELYCHPNARQIFKQDFNFLSKFVPNLLPIVNHKLNLVRACTISTLKKLFQMGYKKIDGANWDWALQTLNVLMKEMISDFQLANSCLETWDSLLVVMHG